jgi:hypothetical protein
MDIRHLSMTKPGRTIMRFGVEGKCRIGENEGSGHPVSHGARCCLKAIGSLLYLSAGTNFRAARDIGAGTQRGRTMAVGRHYVKRQALMLLEFAKLTHDPKLAATLIERAADLKSKLDQTAPPPDMSPHAPDVESSP